MSRQVCVIVSRRQEPGRRLRQAGQGRSLCLFKCEVMRSLADTGGRNQASDGPDILRLRINMIWEQVM